MAGCCRVVVMAALLAAAQQVHALRIHLPGRNLAISVRMKALAVEPATEPNVLPDSIPADVLPDSRPTAGQQGLVVPTRGAASIAAPSAAPASVLHSWRGGGRTHGTAAKELLKRYGGAYLLCSVAMSLCSFSLFYLLVSAGVDASAVLKAVGINLRGSSQRVGRIGLAYVLHKAASPIRFPPTVALTAVVAKRIEEWRGAQPAALRMRSAVP